MSVLTWIVIQQYQRSLNTISQQWFLIVRMKCPKRKILKVLPPLKIWLYCYIQPIWRETNTERICISPQKPFLSEEVLHTILEKKPLFIIIDSHGIAEKGKRHIEFDKICEANGCHVIENVDLSCIGNQKEVQLKILININHQSTGKPCELYCV